MAEVDLVGLDGKPVATVRVFSAQEAVEVAALWDKRRRNGVAQSRDASKEKASEKSATAEGAVPMEQWVRVIRAKLEARGSSMRHNTAEAQEWVLGRTLGGEDKELRAEVDRARMDAYAAIVQERGGMFSYTGTKDGRAAVWEWQQEAK